LPVPVENARTAILAAFARKANSEAFEAVGSDLLSSTRPARAAFGSYRPVPAELLRTRAQPSAAIARDLRLPVTTFAEKKAPQAPPAKAEDARASVRAAFAKARAPASAAEETASAQAMQPTESAGAHAASVAARSNEDAQAEARKPAAYRVLAAASTAGFEDARAAARPSIEEARAAMLATLAKARAIPRKPRSNGRTAASASRESAGRVNGTATVRAHGHAAQSSASNHSPNANAKAAEVQRSSPPTDAVSVIRAAIEETLAAGAHSTKSRSPARASLPPAPAPAGFAAVHTMLNQ
jgi:hypothetical protein